MSGVNTDDVDSASSSLKAGMSSVAAAVKTNQAVQSTTADNSVTMPTKDLKQPAKISPTTKLEPTQPVKAVQMKLSLDALDQSLVMKQLAQMTSSDDKINISIFDFGGQEVFDVIHHLFLKRQAMYIVAFNIEWLAPSSPQSS